MRDIEGTPKNALPNAKKSGDVKTATSSTRDVESSDEQTATPLMRDVVSTNANTVTPSVGPNASTNGGIVKPITKESEDPVDCIIGRKKLRQWWPRAIVDFV